MTINWKRIAKIYRVRWLGNAEEWCDGRLMLDRGLPWALAGVLEVAHLQRLRSSVQDPRASAADHPSSQDAGREDMKINACVRHVSGAWPCGCSDTTGTVTKLKDIDGEAMAFVGTPCFWQWFPVDELVEASES